MNLVELIEAKVLENRLLNEASEVEVTKDIFEMYSKVFENLSDAFNDMNNKANVDGNGKVSEDLRKVEVAVQDIKKKLKAVSNSKSKERFDSTIKKVLGEMAGSLSKLKERVDRDILPHFDVEEQAEFSPDEEPSEEIVGEE